MPGLTVPTPAALVNWTQRTILDGVPYVLRFRWNARMSRWTMTLSDENGNLLRGGIVLVIDTPLLRSRTPDMPPGQLVCVDTSGRREPAGLEDLGSRVLLKYYTQAQLQGIENANTIVL